MGVKVYGGIDKIFKYEDSIGVIIINSIDYEDGKWWVVNKKMCLNGFEFEEYLYYIILFLFRYYWF